MKQDDFISRKYRNEMFERNLLWCSDCKSFLPVPSFCATPSRTGNYGYNIYCRSCISIRGKKYYNKKGGHTLRHTKLKTKFVELAGGCCQYCGYNKFIRALSFHHINPAEKEYNPQIIINSGDFEKAYKELDKCCLLCMNCHIAYEAKLWQAQFSKRNGLGWTIKKTTVDFSPKRY